MDPKSLSFMVEQQVKKMIGRKAKEADIHIIDNASERPRGITSAYATPAVRPYQQQVQSTQVPNRAFNQIGRLDPPRPLRKENQEYTLLPMPMADLYAYLMERKLVTMMFSRPKEGPSVPGFDPSKKCEHHFGAEGNSFEEFYHLRDRVQDLVVSFLSWPSH